MEAYVSIVPTLIMTTLYDNGEFCRKLLLCTSNKVVFPLVYGGTCIITKILFAFLYQKCLLVNLMFSDS